MEPTKKTARAAGLLYLIVVLTGIFNLGYVPSQLIIRNDPTATLQAISENELLFRFGILSGIICYITFLFLPFLLYKLLHSVNKKYAHAMVILAVVSVPLSLINLVNKFSVLTLINNTADLRLFETSNLLTQLLLLLDRYNYGIQLVSIFWGLWLLPFGYLVFKSGFLPKVLGLFLIVGCFGYLINFLGNFLCPTYGDLGISWFIALPATIGEIGTCLWLLIVGIKDKQII